MDMLLIDIKGAFDHVSCHCLLHTIEGIKADGDWMQWTQLYILNRRVALVVNGHHCEETAMDLGFQQGSPVSLILLTIHLSGIFKEVENEVE